MAELLSIVVPVYNEAGSLEPLMQEIADAVPHTGHPFEVIFVDDGSTDRSFEVMERLTAAHPNVRALKLRRNFGKAAALAHGFADARGEIIVTLDGDRQDDPAEIPKLLAKLDEGYDLVSGWKQRRQDPVTKTVPSRFFNWTVRKATGIPLHDFNCGLKAYRREVVQNINLYGELHRYVPVVASDRGFKVGEVKVAHRRRSLGRSKYGARRYLRGYLDLLTVLFLGRFQHRPLHLFGGLGTLVLVIGVLIDIYLTIDKLAFGHAIGQRPLFVLGNLLIVVGVQLLSLGLLSELVTSGRARSGRERYEIEREVDYRSVFEDTTGVHSTPEQLPSGSTLTEGGVAVPGVEPAAAGRADGARLVEPAPATAKSAPAKPAGGDAAAGRRPSGP
jgi:glycosyltransferase involved in cell wall biosynthesis